MKKKLFLIMMCILSISLSNAQLTSLAIVGSGTTQGWPNDPQVDAHQLTTSDGENWSVNNLALLSGTVKFRGNNSWGLPYNWGGASFPSGTAVVDANGMTTVSGVYNITFNSTSGVYNFILQTSTFPVIGIIGDATPGGWSTDTDMTTIDGVNYSINRVSLVAGAIKFRQDHTWTPTTNWGGTTFSSGTGIADGAAITVPTAGKYNVTFNLNTLAYTFRFPSVAIVGPGAGGWPNDPQTDVNQMTTSNGIDYAINNLVLSAGDAKFRANNSWAVNWGATDFPNGTAILDSSSSFSCVASTYNATFNYDSGVYSFMDVLSLNSFNSTSLMLYPNPTATNWNFDFKNLNISNIEIFDVSGKTIINMIPKSNQVTIDASPLNRGIYFAKITTATDSKTIKIIRK